MLRKSELSKWVFSSILPVRYPLPSGLNRVCAPDGLCGCFGQTEMLHLAFRDQVFDRTSDILDRDAGVYAVLIEQINAVGLEPPERILGDFADSLGAAIEAVGRLAVLEPELRCDDHLVAIRR